MRVRLAENVWVGGWFGQNSFLSGWPEPRDIFIESQWKIDETGAFPLVCSIIRVCSCPARETV